MPNKDELSITIQKIFSCEELNVNPDDEIHGKIYATNDIEVHIFVPKELVYIQLHVEMGIITDEDVCALLLYCMSANIRDESWPRRVFGIDPECRMIVYAQLFPVTADSSVRLKDAAEGLAHAAHEHRNEIDALIASIGDGASGEGSHLLGELIFKA